MITMVSIFARSARVAASPLPEVDTRSLLAQPISAAIPNARNKGRGVRSRSIDFMGVKYRCPCRHARGAHREFDEALEYPALQPMTVYRCSTLLAQADAKAPHR